MAAIGGVANEEVHPSLLFIGRLINGFTIALWEAILRQIAVQSLPGGRNASGGMDYPGIQSFLDGAHRGMGFM